MNKYLSSNQLDSYEAEIVEDIPEQFDLSRYRKNKMNIQQQQQQRAQNTGPINPNQYPANQNFYNSNGPPSQLQQNFVYPILNNFNIENEKNLKLNGNSFIDFNNYQNNKLVNADANLLNNFNNIILSQYSHQFNTNYPQIKNFQLLNNPLMQFPANQQNLIQQSPAMASRQQHYKKEQYPPPPANPQIVPTHSRVGYYAKNEYDPLASTQYIQGVTTMKKKSSSVPRYLPENNLSTEFDDPKYLSKQPMPTSPNPAWPKQKQDGRKKNSFEDEENESPYQKKEYYLKGGDENETKFRFGLASRENSVEDKLNLKSESNFHKSTSKLDSASTTMPKSSLKPSTKKSGVTFDEKLEVYEVKNPHYGLEVKSEKRELRKKKKDKQKEEEIIIKTKIDMKNKIQSQNMLHYFFYEKTLIYNTLVFYEENYYRNSILKLQDKLRSNKPDEKLREQFLQMIEKDNQITVDIIRYVKKDFFSKLEPYCNQYQTTIDKLHNIPGMFQVMQTAVNSVNYTEIINYYTHKDSNGSPSALKKILGHEARIEKFLNNFPNSQIKPPLQRKADLWLPKHVLAAIDLHARDVCMINYKSITELVYKLNEICENDLHITRVIYKYILITQLEAFRRNETGAMVMRNFDLGIESVNTIFGRLCSFAGIENRFVRGLWKTICQEPGEKVEAKCVWNVVNLESGWRFMQPAFTPIKFFSKPDVMSCEESEFYYLSDPDALFYEFLPNDKAWLFNETSLDVKNFISRPIITPYFRSLNLLIVHLNNHPSGNLEKEPFKMAIRYPPEYADLLNFKYTIKPINPISNRNNNNNNSQISTNTDNNNNNTSLYVISELLSDKNEILFKISALPEIGSYNLTIFASLSDDLNNPGQSISLASNLSEDAKAIVSIRLICSKITHFEIPPNHISEINVFGMNNTMKRLGLIATDFKQGVLGTDREGRVNLVFEMMQPLDIEAYLYSSDPSISTKYLELCLLKRVVHNFLILIINPPHAGLYGLDLHGAPKGTFNSILHSQMPQIGKFLIKCHHQVRSFLQFPKGDNRDWGPKQSFYDLGLHTVGNIDPYIVNEDGKQIEIEIATLKPVTMWYKFDYDQNGTPRAIDNFCFMNYKNSNRKDKTVSFLLRFPYRGFYHLAVMANDDVFPTKPDEIVFNYLIRVQDPSNEVESFPIILNPILWKDCCLIAPKNFRLNSYDVHFSIIVPKTNQVQISNHGDNRVIDKLEPKEIENSWVGLVTLSSSSSIVYIEAEYDNKFKRLIKFKGLSTHL